MNTTLKSLITSFTKSIDLYNYLLKNHHRRTAIASYTIGRAMNLSEQELSDLVMAAALHDVGALTVSERDDLVRMDVENPFPHARLGCYILESFEPFQKISRIIFYHHWPFDKDNNWNPEKGKVPMASYILHLADRIEILINHDHHILTQRDEIKSIINSYSGTLFHPAVVDAFNQISELDVFWLDIENMSMSVLLEQAISENLAIELSLEMLEQFAYTISNH